MGTISAEGNLLTEEPYIGKSQYFDSKENYITSSVDQRGKRHGTLSIPRPE